MARGVSDRSGLAIIFCRAFLAPAVCALLILTPVAAGASGGNSEWPPTGGSSQWVVEPTEEAPQPTPATDPEPDPTATDRPVAAEPPEPIMAEGIVFPVAGPADYSASFGAPRPGGRTHEGVDIFAEKLTPVVAAAAGTISFIRAGVGTDCCVVKIQHDDGRNSLYLHLNNDTPGTDDGQGYGLADDITLGVRVEAGTVIGFVGDSGNAEETSPHLHYELHDPVGTELDPFPYLQVAQGAEPALFASALLAQPETLPETGLTAGWSALLALGLLGGGARLAARSSRTS